MELASLGYIWFSAITRRRDRVLALAVGTLAAERVELYLPKRAAKNGGSLSGERCSGRPGRRGIATASGSGIEDPGEVCWKRHRRVKALQETAFLQRLDNEAGAHLVVSPDPTKRPAE